MTDTEDLGSVPDIHSSAPSSTPYTLSAYPTELPGEWVVRPAAPVDPDTPVDTGIAAYACIREEAGGHFLYPSLPGFPRSGPFDGIAAALADLSALLASAGLRTGRPAH